ncbi:PTS sugar transporter subunit IIC [Marinilactibacillus piezotolerans]|uniref:PTS sugar transporter subunit IIC n=1 Tax=Marinilactibacillus piezotolerans TaxID=258723 RepID=UPI0009B15E86|nr:PTS transporter subunit EIIC [Marinilactibacillus piezotolerans]
MEKNNTFIDRFTMFAVKLGNQVHLRSLRDAFAVIIPFFILAGLAVLINSVVFPWLFTGETLAKLETWGNVITNGTLNLASLLIAPMIAYSLSKNKGFQNPLSSAAIALGTLIIMMPLSITLPGLESGEDMLVSGGLTFTNLGTTGMFSGIIIGLLATEVFIRISRFKKLQINLGEGVPPAVSRSFTVMLPTMITLSLFGVLSAVLIAGFDTNLIELITTLIQEPLRKVNTSLIGTIVIYSFSNFLFTIGIHQTVVNGAILDPLTLQNMNENMLAFNAGEAAPHIITNSFISTFGMIGGTGSTIALMIAIFIFAKLKSSREVASISLVPGIFNINEPIIFGYPIVFNLPMMIPFVLLPAIGIAFAYFCTVIGFLNRSVILVPWTTPPLINAYLTTAGDWRAIVVQLIILIFGVFLYLPFIKISERVSIAQAKAESE